MTNTSGIIRVRIPTVTVKVDAEAWAVQFGKGMSLSEVRADVKVYFNIAEYIPSHLVDVVKVV